jgi:hypothetical protein
LGGTTGGGLGLVSVIPAPGGNVTTPSSPSALRLTRTSGGTYLGSAARSAACSLASTPDRRFQRIHSVNPLVGTRVVEMLGHPLDVRRSFVSVRPPHLPLASDLTHGRGSFSREAGDVKTSEGVVVGRADCGMAA